MPTVNIKVRNKIAVGDRSRIVCGNSDYIAIFDFDTEWDAHDVKTARFVYPGRDEYMDVVFEGSTCPVPVLSNTIGVKVGVFAGDLRTTTSAWFDCDKSILCGTGGSPVEPEPDVYAQLMTLIQGIEITDRKTMEEAVAAAAAAAESAVNAAKEAETALGESSWIGFELDEDGTLYAVLSPGADASFYLDENGYLEVAMNV